MKRAILTLTLPLLLAGCAQIFDANLFSSLDKPAKLDASALAKKSAAELTAQAASDPGFYDQLKDDPATLTAIQDSLNDQLTNATTDQGKIDAASALVTITANGSGVADLKDQAISSISTIKDELSKTPIKFVNVIKIFLTGQTEAEIKATLDNLMKMADALATMQQVARNPADDTIISSVFFSGTTDATAFAQTALMAAIAKALVIDSVAAPGSGTTSVASSILFQDAPTFPSTGEMDSFSSAYDAVAATTKVTDFKPTTYSYAYVATIKGKLPF